MTIQIELNGEVHHASRGDSVHDLIESMGLSGQALAVAINRQVVPRAKWQERALQPGDRVDLVRAIGGG